MSRRSRKASEPREARAAIYIRVSTIDQEQEGTSLDTQLAACRSFAIEHGYTVEDERVYREVYTGTELWQRPRLSALRDAMRAREFEALVAYAIDRLSRDPVHLGVLLTEAEHAGIDVHFVSEPLDHTPEGQLIRFVRGYAAKVEHEKIKERTMRGRVARARSGRLIPGWKPLYGYRWADEDKTRYEVDEVTALVVRRIYEETLQGRSRRELCKHLTEDGVPTPSSRERVWRVSTLGRILTNAAYTGTAAAFCQRNSRSDRGLRGWRPRDEWINLPEGTIPAILEPAIFAAVQRQFALNKHKPRIQEDDFALLRAGFVICGYCEHNLHVRRKATSGPRYICANYGYAGTCGEVPTISIRNLDRVVWEKIHGVLTRPEIIAGELERLQAEEPSQAELGQVERALTELERRQRALIENLSLVESDAAALIREQLAELSARRRTLEAQRQEALGRQAAWKQAQARIDRVQTWCANVAARLGTMGYHQRRLALDALDVQVKVWKQVHTPRYEIVAKVPLEADPNVAVHHTTVGSGGSCRTRCAGTSGFRRTG